MTNFRSERAIVSTFTQEEIDKIKKFSETPKEFEPSLRMSVSNKIGNLYVCVFSIWGLKNSYNSSTFDEPIVQKSILAFNADTEAPLKYEKVESARFLGVKIIMPVITPTEIILTTQEFHTFDQMQSYQNVV